MNELTKKVHYDTQDILGKIRYASYLLSCISLDIDNIAYIICNLNNGHIEENLNKISIDYERTFENYLELKETIADYNLYMGELNKDISELLEEWAYKSI